MPSKTAKQAAAMRAACHADKPRKGGIPKDVACEFVRHDMGLADAKKKKLGYK